MTRAVKTQFSRPQKAIIYSTKKSVQPDIIRDTTEILILRAPQLSAGKQLTAKLFDKSWCFQHDIYVKLLFEKSLRWFRWLRMDEMVEMAVFTCVRFWCNKHLKSPKYIQPRKLTYLIS